MSMLLTTHEVATLLRVHPKHVYRLLRKGLPARRVGGEWRFLREEVLAWGASRAGRSASVPAPAGASSTGRLIAANDDVIVDLLLAGLHTNARVGPLLGRVPADAGVGLELLAAGAVVGAGFHGQAPPASAGGTRLVHMHLFGRQVGLVYPRRRPTPTLGDLARLRLASRPTSAGSRVHLDAALQRARLSPARLNKNATFFASSRDVACAVARNDADVGVATRAWASRLGLGFTELVVEPYWLLLDAAHLGDPAVTLLCEAAQAPAFSAAVHGVPGSDPRGAGTLTFFRA